MRATCRSNAARRRRRRPSRAEAGAEHFSKSSVSWSSGGSPLQRSIIAPAERVTNLRWGMVAILAFGVLTAYFCLAVASVAHVRHAFGFDVAALRSLSAAARWSFIGGTLCV